MICGSAAAACTPTHPTTHPVRAILLPHTLHKHTRSTHTHTHTHTVPKHTPSIHHHATHAAAPRPPPPPPHTRSYSIYGCITTQLGDVTNEFIEVSAGNWMSVAQYVEQTFNYQ